MGMFDWVDFRDECPQCKKTVKGFQSKSGACELKIVKPWKVDNFYSSCAGCGAWIEYTRKRPKLTKQDFLKHYVRIVTLNDDK